MTRHIEIVTHVYDPPGLEQYSRLLRVQAASLVRWRPSCDVTLTVCMTHSDRSTALAVEEASAWLDGAEGPGGKLRLQVLLLLPGKLFRRAIGRNIRAKSTDADVVWMTDVDYFFGQYCLDDVAALVDQSQPLSMPAWIWIHRDHATGDAELARASRHGLPVMDLAKFVQRKQKICIGGVQILSGEWARAHGYLDGTKWVEPVSAQLGFRSCVCDHHFRRHYRLSAERLPIRSVYRCRHTKDGRDFAADGTRMGRAAW